MRFPQALLQQEQLLLDEVSGPRMMEYTAGIARFERLSGSEDERESFGYVKELLDGFGLTTRLYEHDAYISLPGPASIELADGTRLACYTTSFGRSTPAGGVTGELVYCGAGTLEELAEKDLRGKIALLDGLPAAPKTIAVEAAGAIGQINIAGKHLHWMIISPVWGSPTPDRLDRLPKRPCVTITGADGAKLMEQVDRDKTIAVRIYAKVDTAWRKTPLLVADLAGEDPDFVLFSGHLDSWAFGAMDNGTANATMIEMARLLAKRRGQLKRGVRFAFWSGHSHGRYSGSTWYADQHWEELHQRCVCHLNIDSVGGQGATVLGEAIVMPDAKSLAQMVVGEQTGEDFEGRRIGRMGDQSFLGLGVPSVFMSLSEQPASDDPTSKAMNLRMGGKRSGGLGWWWHTAEDTIDRIDPAFLVRDARIYASVLWRLLLSPVLPYEIDRGAADLYEQLESLKKVAGERFDLSVPIGRASDLVEVCRELTALAQGAGAERHAAIINQTIRSVQRLLIPVGYTVGSVFDHDPAVPTPAIPGLDPVRRLVAMGPDSDEAHFLTTQLVRSRNRVAYALLQATEACVAGLKTLKEE